MYDYVQDSSQGHILNGLNRRTGVRFTRTSTAPPVRNLRTTLQLTADTLNTRAEAALVVPGAGCAGINARVPVVGYGLLREKNSGERDTQEWPSAGYTRGWSDVPRSTLPPRSTLALEHQSWRR